jgi:DNA-binding CsgD family transcriptional regulator
MPKGGAQARGLSTREREVAELVAAGKSNRAISETLFLSERAVEYHVTSILNKLNLHSRVELIVELGTAAQQSTPANADTARAAPRNVLSRSLKAASAPPRLAGV